MAEGSASRTLTRAVSAVTVSAGISKAVMLAVEVLLARHLGLDGFSSYAVAAALIIVISSTGAFGMDHGVVQLMTRPRSGLGGRRIVAAAIMMAATAATVLGGGLAIFAEPLGRSLSGSAGMATVLRIAAIAAAIETVNNVLAAALRVHHRYSLSIGVFDGIRNLSLGVGAVTALGGSSPARVLTFFAIGAALGTVVGTIAVLTSTPAGSDEDASLPHTVGELWRFSRNLSVWGIIQLSSTQLYVVVAGFILPAEEVSALAVGLRVVVLLGFLRTSLAIGIQRELAVLNHEGQLARMKQVLISVSMSLLVASGLICLPFLIGPSTVMRAFGDEWVPYAWIIWPLLVPKLINVMTSPTSQALIATGNGARLLRLSLIEMSLQFTFLIPAALAFGLAGFVAAEAVRVTAMVIGRHLALVRTTGIHSFSASQGRALVAIGGAVGLGAAIYAGVGHLAGFGVGVVVAALAIEALLRVVVRPPASPLILGLRFVGLADPMSRLGKDVEKCAK